MTTEETRERGGKNKKIEKCKGENFPDGEIRTTETQPVLGMVWGVLRRSEEVQATRKEENGGGKRGEKCENSQVKISPPRMGRKNKIETYPGMKGRI